MWGGGRDGDEKREGDGDGWAGGQVGGRRTVGHYLLFQEWEGGLVG